MLVRLLAYADIGQRPQESEFNLVKISTVHADLRVVNRKITNNGYTNDRQDRKSLPHWSVQRVQAGQDSRPEGCSVRSTYLCVRGPSPGECHSSFCVPWRPKAYGKKSKRHVVME